MPGSIGFGGLLLAQRDSRPYDVWSPGAEEALFNTVSMTAPSMSPRLRFPASKISHFASRYEYASDDAILKLRPTVSRRGYLLKNELFQVARWKAPRNQNRVLRNSEDDIKEITRFALRTTSERARVESLLILFGVAWPMASVILHFFHEERYPILDFRALWSIQVEVPSYHRFESWFGYVSYCRDLANKNGVDMRTLDKALWQYSLENQKAGSR